MNTELFTHANRAELKYIRVSLVLNKQFMPLLRER